MNIRKRARPVWADEVAQVDPDRVRQPLVYVGGLAVWRDAPDHRGHSVDEAPEFLFAELECLLRPDLIVDVVADSVPLQDVPRMVAQRLCPARHPTIRAVYAAQPVAQRERFSGRQAAVEC